MNPQEKRKSKTFLKLIHQLAIYINYAVLLLKYAFFLQKKKKFLFILYFDDILLCNTIQEKRILT